MGMDANTGPIPGDRLLHPTASGLNDLLEIVREQQARIERLESALLPLPGATERDGAGRQQIRRAARRKHVQPSYPPLSAVEAFQDLAPSSDQYATLPILEGFNWSECATRLGAGEWYMVVFRSLRREAVDDLTLEMHDYGAYIEAHRRAAGLVFYFRGTPNERRECLSFCIWEGREEAARAARLPLHRVAMSLVEEKYEWYTLERYWLRKQHGRRDVEAIPVDAGGVPLVPN
ncbi:MAG TPA: hypothetical protein VKX16_06400 [Chloroflexota bacterium]|nr:hypothetical protein [Chloroflexota bacterium]